MRPTLNAANRERPPDHLDEMLDEALKLTFPASDPIAVAVEPTPGAPADDEKTLEKDPTCGSKGGPQKKPR